MSCPRPEVAFTPRCSQGGAGMDVPHRKARPVVGAPHGTPCSSARPIRRGCGQRRHGCLRAHRIGRAGTRTSQERPHGPLPSRRDQSGSRAWMGGTRLCVSQHGERWKMPQGVQRVEGRAPMRRAGSVQQSDSGRNEARVGFTRCGPRFNGGAKFRRGNAAASSGSWRPEACGSRGTASEGASRPTATSRSSPKGGARQRPGPGTRRCRRHNRSGGAGDGDRPEDERPSSLYAVNPDLRGGLLVRDLVVVSKVLLEPHSFLLGGLPRETAVDLDAGNGARRERLDEQIVRGRLLEDGVHVNTLPPRRAPRA